MAKDDGQIDQGPRCAAGVDARSRVLNLEKSDTKQWNAINDLWRAINSIRNRPPIWASLGIAVLLGIIGYLVRALNGG